jgi:nucleoside-diphosphate-sugar epimerase
MENQNHVLITGGAGYIGSLLTGVLLRAGYQVTVVDDLLYGGESLLLHFANPDFNFVKADVWESRAIRSSIQKNWSNPFAVVHLAAIVGFPACQAVGRQVAWRYNVETTEHVYEQCLALDVERFVYLSTYSSYGLTPDGSPATEETSLNPQSLYAETKIASERYLLSRSEAECAPLIFRPATLYGLSPRPRFDLIVNQFVLDAYLNRELMIYQRGYYRSFIHIQDVVAGIISALQTPLEVVRDQVFNIGTEHGNLTKDEVVMLILKRLPETDVIYKDLTFGGDMRDISVSFEKIKRVLEFEPRFSVDDGIREVFHALRFSIIKDPKNQRYRNARFIVQ